MGGRSGRPTAGPAAEAIGRKAFLRVAKALILGMKAGLTDPLASMEQKAIEEIAEVLGMGRCVVFAVSHEESEGAPRASCRIAAAVPPEEYGPDSRSASPLEAHPDIKAAMENGKVMVIKDPSRDERTAYFRGMIGAKEISEIAYIPLCAEEGSRPERVIVLDAVRGRSFSEDEIEFCAETAELFSLLLGQESITLQHFRDAVINKVVPLGGFACRLQENLRSTLDYIEIIREKATALDCIIPKKLNGGVHQKNGS